MGALSRLGLPCLTAEAVAFLDGHGIYTVEDFLAYDLYRLGDGELQKQVIAGLLQHVAATTNCTWTDGATLFERLTTSTTLVSTGCPSIDDVIGGGLRPGTITELVGTSASGKTQLCLQAAAAAALELRASVAFIDTSNSFSAHRLAQIVTGLHGKDKFVEHKQELRNVARRVLCFKAFDIYTALRLLDDLLVHMDGAESKRGGDGNQGDFFQKLQLLILDSASAIISPVLGGAHTQGHALMVSLSGLLRQIALKHNIAVLVTNHTVSGEGGRPKPALGESWKSVPSVRLALAREDESDCCTATVTKHTIGACGESVPYVLSRDGLRAFEAEEPGATQQLEWRQE
ncbi:DNA repair protein RAD51 [Klebsormidium nitens]|uniref:DNA repair protein RAD51 n=1 Tax=Klebsormidium nitens TaxID=105231 RepID=A0A1Y1HKY4_KLENI|nr:DNA repair protein RAD51 [Klebsormidium nitens]|eukprot:GAQ77799.1 DNA repair protein RAD51 [Klebsormidium nitens]